jgi:hypothetical protein
VNAHPADDDDELGGVHIKYLLHCPRQLWLYEQGSEQVAFGEAVDGTAYARRREVDLGAAKVDWVTTGAVVHETKSSHAPSEQHEAQVRHYCLLLERRGMNVRGGRPALPADPAHGPGGVGHLRERRRRAGGTGRARGHRTRGRSAEAPAGPLPRVLVR